jgi:hypothetical protein
VLRIWSIKCISYLCAIVYTTFSCMTVQGPPGNWYLYLFKGIFDFQPFKRSISI